MVSRCSRAAGLDLRSLAPIHWFISAAESCWFSQSTESVREGRTEIERGTDRQREREREGEREWGRVCERQRAAESKSQVESTA